MNFEEKPTINRGTIGDEESLMVDGKLKGESVKALYVLHFLKNNPKEISKKYSIDEVSRSLEELMNNIDDWINKWYEDDWFDNEDIDPNEEIVRIEKEWAREVVELYNDSTIRGGVALYKMMGFSNEEILRFYQKHSEDLSSKYIINILEQVSQENRKH